MSTLIARRVAGGTRELWQQADKRMSARVSASADTATALDEWEAEGGMSAGVAQVGEPAVLRVSPADRQLLERLGAAVVCEWNNLPMPLQRAVYERAANGVSPWNRLSMRRQMARFLHDHKRPGPA